MALPTFLLLLALLSCTYSQMANYIIAYNSTTALHLPYSYTTLGNPPTAALNASVIFLSKHNLSDDCWFCASTNISALQGKIAIMESLPDWFPCAQEPFGRAPALGRIFQKVGGVGVIMLADEEFHYGSVLAFDPSVRIPFVVVQQKAFLNLIQQNSSFTTIELPAISVSDAKWLSNTTAVYLASRVVIAFLFSFVLYHDIREGRKVLKLNFHGVFLKVTAFVAAFVGFFYVTVDPFGFYGISVWNSQFVITIYSALYAIVLMLLLQIWIVTTGSITTKIVQSKWFAYIISYFPECEIFKCRSNQVDLSYIHLVPIFEIILACAQGWIKGSNFLAKFYWGSFLAIYVSCGVGFIVFGKNIITILRQSGNVLQGSEPLARKIIIFTICYLVFMYTATSMYTTNVLGAVFSLLVCMEALCALSIAAIIILFLPPVLKKRKKERKTRSRTETRKTSTLSTPTNSLQKPLTCSLDIEPTV